MSEITRYEGIHGHMRSKKGRLVLFTDHEAAIALKDGTIAADDERLVKAAEKAGITYMGCDTADWLAETVVELMAELGTKEAAIAFLRESLRMSNLNAEEYQSELAERNKTIAALMETKHFLESEIRRWSESRDGIMAENEAIEERNIKLTAELAACREALMHIADPVRWMIEHLKLGEKLNGQMAIELSKDHTYLKGIAQAAMKEANHGE